MEFIWWNELADMEKLLMGLGVYTIISIGLKWRQNSLLSRLAFTREVQLEMIYKILFDMDRKLDGIRDLTAGIDANTR